MDRVDVYIDESGIGRKVGASVYCLTVTTTKEASDLDNEVLRIEEKFKIPPFHWREHSWKIKTKFLKEILKTKGWYSITIIISNLMFSNKLAEELMAKALQGLNIKRMFIDGKKSKVYVNTLKRSLKGLGISVSTLKLVRHQSKGALRISDSIAGLARLNYDKKAKREAREFFERFLRQKITTQILSGY